MKILLSPAKRMKADSDSLPPAGLPEFLGQAAQILGWLRERSPGELKRLWKCSDEIARQNVDRIRRMDLEKGLTPAVLSYEGIAYQYMAPAVFEDGQYAYIQGHLRILSAFYGVLKPMDGVTPYRLEMQAKASIDGHKDLYALWGRRLYEAVRDDSGVIVNLASREYARCVEKYLTKHDRYLTITFCEKSGDRLVTKGTYAKMARGDMVRFMAERGIEDPADLRAYDRLGYAFRPGLSGESEYVFERAPGQKEPAPAG